jgi:hypothetical protein
MIPILLQSKRKDVKGYRKPYVLREAKAIAKAGFEVMELETGMFGISNDPNYDMTGRTVITRHYAGEDRAIVPYVEAHGGTLAVPGYANVQDWYKLPLDVFTDVFMGGRRMAWYPLAPYGYLETLEESKALRLLIEKAFDEFAIDGKVFAKSETKNSFSAGLYTKDELIEDLTFLLGISCHRMPKELIISQPMPITELPHSKYKKDEYRCLIVDNKVSSVSLYTDDPRPHRDYKEVEHFAQQFANAFQNKLPKAYDLDVARLTNDKLAVVELNDISACGFFADNDLDKLFADLYRLAAPEQDDDLY